MSTPVRAPEHTESGTAPGGSIDATPAVELQRYPVELLRKHRFGRNLAREPAAPVFPPVRARLEPGALQDLGRRQPASVAQGRSEDPAAVLAEPPNRLSRRPREARWPRPTIVVKSGAPRRTSRPWAAAFFAPAIVAFHTLLEAAISHLNV